MSVQGEEIFEIVDENDRVIGKALRSECHGNPALIHRVAHVLVFNSRREVLLQKRSCYKDIQPGRWDTSVGGHLMPGESYWEAARRESFEEIGLVDPELKFLYFSGIRNSIESENVGTFYTIFDGPFEFNPKEIDELKFWDASQIQSQIGKEVFTPNFEEEWKYFQSWFEKRKFQCDFQEFLS